MPAGLAWRMSEPPPERVAEVARIPEAPRERDRFDRLMPQGRVQEIAATALQTLDPDQVMNGRGTNGAVERALRAHERRRQRIDRQSRIAKMLVDMNAHALRKGGPLRNPRHR